MTARGLEVSDVVVEYEAAGRWLPAVAGVSFDVVPGEVLGLLGPSGCGKSTLLRAIAGLERLIRGAVSWDGADLAPVPVHRRGFGLMFQDGQLFPHRDVAGNVAFGLQMAGLGPAERAPRVHELLAMVGLEGFERRQVETLSGGERQRVALARSLAPTPRLLLLDEPAAGMNPHESEDLMNLILWVHREFDLTILLIEHQMRVVMGAAQRIIVLDFGETIAEGTPAEIQANAKVIKAYLGEEAV